MLNRTINVAILAAILATVWAIWFLDAASLGGAVSQKKREQDYATQVCHRAYGPSTQPEYNTHGVLVCISRRGEVLAAVQRPAQAGKADK